MEMSESVRQAISPALFAFLENLRIKGFDAPSDELPEAVADEFVDFFGLSFPVSQYDVSSLLCQMQYDDVFLLPGMEKRHRVRGYWDVSRNKKMTILLDASRPDPSKIKSLHHETSEQFLLVGYDKYKTKTILSDRDRENWANRFAAMVKMPPDKFKSEFVSHGLNLELLANSIFSDTLAGVARQIRDLCLKDRPFYFCRVSLEHDPEHNCSDLLPCLGESEGLCVYVADSVKTKMVHTRRTRGGGLPFYNAATKSQFRVMHPKLRLYENSDGGCVDKMPPMYIPRLRGASGFEGFYEDLFGSQDLAVLIFPIGKRKLKGFYLVAVHPDDASLFDELRETTPVIRGEDMDWIFSWVKEEYERVPDDELEEELADQKRLELRHDEDKDWVKRRIRWPRVEYHPDQKQWEF